MAACVRLADDYGGPVSSFQKSFFRNVVALAIALVVFARSRLDARRNGAVGGTRLTPGSLVLLLLRSALISLYGVEVLLGLAKRLAARLMLLAHAAKLGFELLLPLIVLNDRLN